MNLTPKVEPTVRSEDLAGTWRRFGPTGPVYEVLGVGPNIGRDQTMRIRLVETGEEVAYRLEALLGDPREG